MFHKEEVVEEQNTPQEGEQLRRIVILKSPHELLEGVEALHALERHLWKMEGKGNKIPCFVLQRAAFLSPFRRCQRRQSPPGSSGEERGVGKNT